MGKGVLYLAPGNVTLHTNLFLFCFGILHKYNLNLPERLFANPISSCTCFFSQILGRGVFRREDRLERARAPATVMMVVVAIYLGATFKQPLPPVPGVP